MTHMKNNQNWCLDLKNLTTLPHIFYIMLQRKIRPKLKTIHGDDHSQRAPRVTASRTLSLIGANLEPT
jgi:hypothetical protein